MTSQQTSPEEIFHGAAAILDPAERAEYLAQACQGTESLRREVDALLKRHEKAADFLENPAMTPAVTLEASGPMEAPGTVIGRYRLLEKIGEGGMAVVYKAVQHAHHKGIITATSNPPTSWSRCTTARPCPRS